MIYYAIMTASSDPEITAMGTLASALDGLSEEARARVLSWARSRYGSAAGAAAPSAARVGEAGRHRSALDSFATLGELMGASSPESDDRRALLAAAFISHRAEGGTFTGAQVNGALKHLGHGVDNVTRVLDALIAQRPALVVQLRKSGASRQARKLYKVTEAGLQEAQRLIIGAPP